MRKRDQSQVWCRIGRYSLAKRHFVRNEGEKKLYSGIGTSTIIPFSFRKKKTKKKKSTRKGSIYHLHWSARSNSNCYLFYHLTYVFQVDGKKEKQTHSPICETVCAEGRSSRPNVPGSRSRLQSSNATFRTQTTFDTVHKTIIAWPRLVFLSIAWPSK